MNEENLFYYNVLVAYNTAKEAHLSKLLDAAYTYVSDRRLPFGSIVSIELNHRRALGIVLKRINKVEDEGVIYKKIGALLIDRPLPDYQLQLARWMAKYYNVAMGQALRTMLPSAILKRVTPLPNNIVPNVKLEDPSLRDLKISLNKDQQSAVDAIMARQGTCLLHGITGSGKTAIYKELASRSIAEGRSVIILVPEISLTTQLIDQFVAQFGDKVIATHSKMSVMGRRDAWIRAITSSSDKPVVVVGPRSALFLPVHNPGLIVVDESHEPSYKQESLLRYDTCTVAAKLASLNNEAKLVLGSATPSITNYFVAKRHPGSIIEVNRLARDDAVKPVTTLVDISKLDNLAPGSRIFSKKLIDAATNALSNKQQVLFFHNRRGSASSALCNNCGWLAECPNCHIPLTLHHDKYELHCHLCAYKSTPPPACPECNHPDIEYHGIGTKTIEAEVRRRFPLAIVKRFDSDSPNGENIQDLYHDLKDGKIDIAIGTQSIAKGLDLPNLGVVGIVQADSGLALPDFSSRERTFQLISQACGRVGRHDKPSEVIVQAYNIEHPIIQAGAHQDYSTFYKYELEQRRHGGFPPFNYMLKIVFTYKTERGVIKGSTKISREISEKYGNQVNILGPRPTLYERRNDQYIWQLIIRAPRRNILVDIARELPRRTTMSYELDPTNLL